MDIVAVVIGLAALLATGAVAGLLYGYACSVMLALDRQEPSTAIRVMQTINVVILNPAFLLAFLGALPATLLAAGAAWLAGRLPAAGFFLAAFLAYGFGTFGVTMAFNVPMNTALADAGQAPADPAGVWRAFAPAWNRWNRVRAAAAVAAVVLTGLGLIAL